MPDTHPVPAELGWDDDYDAALPRGLRPARVIAGHRRALTVLGVGPPLLVTLGGRLRHDRSAAAQLPGVGDWVGLDPAGAVVRCVLPRRGAITRSDPGSGAPQLLAANVDVAFVVTSANRDLNARRLERFVALAAGGGAQTVALLNKADSVADVAPALAAVRHAVGSQLPVLPISARRGRGLDALEAWLAPGRTVALLGSSGVGKSTLANALLGADVQATAPIRAVDDRGRHTTVRRELLVLPGGAMLIDTPGLKLPRMSAGGEAATAAFDELAALADRCRFGDCTHDREPGCAVRQAIDDGELAPERLDAARRLQREERWAAEREAQVKREARRRPEPRRRRPSGSEPGSEPRRR